MTQWSVSGGSHRQRLFFAGHPINPLMRRRCCRSPGWVSLVTPVLGLLLILYHLPRSQFRGPQSSLLDEVRGNNNATCPPMPGIEDVLIVLKTGVTEALDKVPVHFQTTLRCVPNYAVFSDFEEEIEGVRVYDVLQDVSTEVKQKVSDFDLYNRVRLFGREGLVAADTMTETNGPRGKPNNPGWKLDKWKFLPMIDKALRISPNSSWYVFMEADTYLVLPNLIIWLSGLDPDEPYYLGTETQIADVTFGHGGSGVILSKPAMLLVSYIHATWRTEVDQYVDAHWAGDCVLGKILAEGGINLTYSWPMLQNSRLGELDSLADIFYRKPWCYPAVGYHHLSVDEIWDMWRFDDDWFQKRQNELLLHCDVFMERIHPKLTATPRMDWDNLCLDTDEVPNDIRSLSDCEAQCHQDPECLQYSYRPNNAEQQCCTAKFPRLGVSRPGVHSGWMMQRINMLVNRVGVCTEPEWV